MVGNVESAGKHLRYRARLKKMGLLLGLVDALEPFEKRFPSTLTHLFLARLHVLL